MTSETLPTAELRIEYHPTNPPRPAGIGVFVEGRLIAVVEWQSALAPALDVVIQEMEAREKPIWDRLSDGSRVPISAKASGTFRRS